VQKLFLEKNPFYILEVSPYDKRADIIAKAEEKAFFMDSSNYEDAQARLLNPEKRLMAELEWFLKLSVDKISEINNSINSKTEISTDDLEGISKLNATLHNLLITNYRDYLELGYAILDVDEQYTNIDKCVLAETINVCHKQSGMREMTKEEIEQGLDRKRNQIRQIIQNKIDSLNKEDYVQLVTIISEKCIFDENYDDGIILLDIIDQYEIWSKSLMDEKEEKIRECIEFIKSIGDDAKITQSVEQLIVLVKEWDMYAQPLQVSMAAKGMEDKVSRDMAIDIRNLAIYLHNEKKKTALSLKIIEALRVYFAELSEVFEVVSKDVEILQKMQREKEEFECKKKLNKQADKKYSVGIYGQRFVIPPFCTCCMKPTENKENVSYSVTIPNGDTRTTKSIEIDMPICHECLEHRNKFMLYLVMISSISVLVAGIIMVIFMLAEIDAFSSFLMSSGMAIGIYYFLSWVLPTKELSIEHSTRGASAKIFSLFLRNDISDLRGKYPDVTFSFTNWEYAHLFREANGEQAEDVREIKDINTAKSTNVLRANKHHISTMFKMLAAFVGVALVIGLVISDIGNSSNYSSSSHKPYSYSSSSVETQFSQSVSPGTKVYEDIVSIFPDVGIYSQGASNYSGFVCKCKTTSDTTVWVYIPVSEYRINFDSSVSTSISNEYAEEITFDYAKKIRGTAKMSNSVLSDLSTDIGVTMLIDFDSVD